MFDWKEAEGVDFSAQRERMVRRQLAGRGIQDEAVLAAMQEVPREAFVPEMLVEFSYADAPLPIGEGQTISQPYIVAYMAELLELSSESRVLDVGTGAGYAAAVMSRIAAEVYTIERHERLVERAREVFDRLGYNNIHVKHGDGTLGWPEHAPYDAIGAAASGPSVPKPLVEQLAVGGRLVMPTGREGRLQKLLRVRRTGEDDYEQEDLGGVQFVPLVGRAGWDETQQEQNGEAPKGNPGSTAAPTRPAKGLSLPEQIREAAEPFDGVDAVNLDGLLKRTRDARVVLLGEATHGTAEFYEMRARITQALIEEHGFNMVAVEADWPDASHINNYVQDGRASLSGTEPFTKFPTWMWANVEVLDFVEWLRNYNRYADERVGFFGMDLYGLHASIDAVLRYLSDVDPEAARIARERYGCLSPWEQDPATYGRLALTGGYQACEQAVARMLKDLLEKRLSYAERDGIRFFDAAQNARLIASAERYYRTMYYGAVESWNLRDQHMFDTLKSLLDFHGPDSRAVVWAHNSHLGDASATEMGARGEHNVGQLAREHFGEEAYLVGFGTHRGTVAAATDWNGEMQVKALKPSHSESYEHLCHTSGVPNFLLPLRGATSELREALAGERLERAVGVVYRPDTELRSHYFRASLPRQFDEYIWLDETRAVTPLRAEHVEGTPETFPFGV